MSMKDEIIKAKNETQEIKNKFEQNNVVLLQENENLLLQLK